MYDKRYMAKCDICGKVKRQAFDFFSIPDRFRMIGVCKACKENLSDDPGFNEDETEVDLDLEYLGATASQWVKPLKVFKAKRPNPDPVIKYEQIPLFPKGMKL